MPKEGEMCVGSLLPATYLHRLEGGREGFLQGAAGKPPHFLREHRAGRHQHVPARRDEKFGVHRMQDLVDSCPVTVCVFLSLLITLAFCQVWSTVQMLMQK